MKKINYVKFSLDLVMALLFVLFFNKSVLGGLTFHEIAGLFFAVAYFTHVLLNIKWVKNVTLKLFDRSLPWKARGSYVLNILLLISMSFIIVSGVFISKIVFPNTLVSDERWFEMTHISVSFLVLALVGIHVGLHWQWILNVWNKIWKYKNKRAWAGYAAKGVTAVILLFGLYEANQTAFMHRLASSATVIGINAQAMQGGAGGHIGEEGKPLDREERPADGKGGFVDRDRMAQGGRPDHRGDAGSVNVFSIISTYTGVMAVFVILVYYLKKTIGIRKKRARSI